MKLLEEYDPNNLEEVSRPYAYVADYVQRVDSSCNVLEQIGKYEQQMRSKAGLVVTEEYSHRSLNGEQETARLGDGTGWLEQLRDQLQRDEEVKWYVVVNGDEERAWSADGTGPRLETAKNGTQTVQQPQYTKQQSAFENPDRDIETRRQQLRKELGYEENNMERLVERRPEMKPEGKPEVPETEPPKLPPLTTNVPMLPSGSSRPKTPKTPGKAFRRFFGRSKTGDTS